MITIHSDDFGYKSYTDTKIIQLLRIGRIKSVSILSTMVDKNKLNTLYNLVSNGSSVKTGLHLNMVEGKSSLKKRYIPTLTGNKNNLFGLVGFILRLFLGQIEKEHLEKEIRSQIYKLTNNGLKLQFIDSHQHIHALSPVAEIVQQIAKEENVETIRNYSQIKNYTLKAKIKYLFLKLIAAISYLIAYGKLGLPVSWKPENGKLYSILSWEGKGVDFTRINNDNLVLITHPYLSFDSNLSYMPFLTV